MKKKATSKDLANLLKEAMQKAKNKFDQIMINQLAARIPPGIQDSVKRLITEFPFSKN